MYEIQPSTNGWRVRNLATEKNVVEDVPFCEAVKIKRWLEANAVTRAAWMAAGN